MRRRLGRLLLALTALALPAFLASEARACECARTGAPCQEYWDADAVFVGESQYEADEGSFKHTRRLVRLSERRRQK